MIERQFGRLPAIAEQFSRRYPGIRMQVIHAETRKLQFHELRERNVELLIGRIPTLFLEDDLVAERLFYEPWMALAGARSQWVQHRRIDLAELIEERWVLPPYDSVPGSLIAEIFRVENLQPPRPSLVSLSGQLTTNLIATGRFVGLLPGSVARFSARRIGLKILPVKLPAQQTTVGIITVKNRTVNPLAERFIDCARDIAKSVSAPTYRRKHA